MTSALLTSEWTKLRSVRSTYLMLAMAVLSTVGVGMLVCHFTASSWSTSSAESKAAFDPLSATFNGLALGQLAIATLGVLALSSEYATGLIRTTFAAVPQRRAVLVAKATVIGALAVVVGQAIAFASFFAGQLMLRPAHIQVSLGHPGVLGAVVAAGLYLVVVPLVGLGLGAAIRHTAGALAALFGLVFLLPQVAHALPTPWNTRVGSYMLQTAAEQMTSLHRNPALLSPTWSAVVLAGYAVAALTLAAWLINRRDA